jgi:hypothetical protein
MFPIEIFAILAEMLVGDEVTFYQLRQVCNKSRIACDIIMRKHPHLFMLYLEYDGQWHLDRFHNQVPPSTPRERTLHTNNGNIMEEHFGFLVWPTDLLSTLNKIEL